jgi:hypothetical protein
MMVTTITTDDFEMPTSNSQGVRDTAVAGLPQSLIGHVVVRIRMGLRSGILALGRLFFLLFFTSLHTLDTL